MEDVRFEGAGPFELPAAQAPSRAEARDDRVVLIFRVLANGTPKIVRISLSYKDALDLTEEMSKASAQIVAAKGQSAWPRQK